MKTSPRKENIVRKSKFWFKNESDLQVEQYFNFNSSHNHVKALKLGLSPGGSIGKEKEYIYVTLVFKI